MCSKLCLVDVAPRVPEVARGTYMLLQPKRTLRASTMLRASTIATMRDWPTVDVGVYLY